MTHLLKGLGVYGGGKGNCFVGLLDTNGNV